MGGDEQGSRPLNSGFDPVVDPWSVHGVRQGPKGQPRSAGRGLGESRDRTLLP
jgi:hypothetical protein